MKKQLTIVKVGGKIVEEESALTELIEQFKQIDGPKLLVHGGGRSATRMAEAMGVETKMVNGRRITDKQMLKVVTMVYAGLVNKNIVAMLQANDLNAVGLTGADGNSILSHKREVGDVDYGFVGDVDEVNALFLSQLLYSEVIPVMVPITHDGKGGLLNTNADTIAAACATGLAELFDVKLIYCFEKKGVLSDPNNEDSVITKLTPPLFKRYLEEGVIVDGMIPKLDNAFEALNKGVQQVVITSVKQVSDSSLGTTIVLSE